MDPRFFATAHEVAANAFGPSRRRGWLLEAWRLAEHEHSWTLRVESIDWIDNILRLMETLEPFPEHSVGPLVLEVSSTFRLRDPDTCEVFPSQDPELYGGQKIQDLTLPLGLSHTRLRLTTRSTCGLFLSLPFPEVTETVRVYARRLDQLLPFPLSKKHWSRWQLNVQGTRYYSRRTSVL